MGVAGGVAAPDRFTGTDAVATYPRPLGGDNGPVALPQRDTPTSTPERPSTVPTTAGAHGAVAAIARYAPPVDQATPELYGNAQPTPAAWIAMHYIRHFVSSGAAVVARFIAPNAGRTSSTSNRTTGDPGAPGSPIPVSRRFIIQTLTQPYGVGRVWSDYMPRDAIQPTQASRRVQKSRELARMGDPYQPRLTRLAIARSYGQDTQTLSNKANPHARSPYDSGPVPILGRFSR